MGFHPDEIPAGHWKLDLGLSWDRWLAVKMFSRLADPDKARRLFRLTDREAEALAQILGAPRIVESYADLTKEIPGLDAGQVEVGDHSPYAGHPLGDAKARTRTGASIVAIVRDEQVLASPGPAEVLQAHDVLVVIGTADGIAAVRHLIDQG